MYCFAAATFCLVALDGASSIGGFPGSFPWLAGTAGVLDLSLGWNFWNQLRAESISTHNGIICGTNQVSSVLPKPQKQPPRDVEMVNHPICSSWIWLGIQISNFLVEPNAVDDTSASNK
jgi:hypothetical protein